MTVLGLDSLTAVACSTRFRDFQIILKEMQGYESVSALRHLAIRAWLRGTAKTGGRRDGVHDLCLRRDHTVRLIPLRTRWGSWR
jgi:hypothetical protein